MSIPQPYLRLPPKRQHTHGTAVSNLTVRRVLSPRRRMRLTHFSLPESRRLSSRSSSRAAARPVGRAANAPRRSRVNGWKRQGSGVRSNRITAARQIVTACIHIAVEECLWRGAFYCPLSKVKGSVLGLCDACTIAQACTVRGGRRVAQVSLSAIRKEFKAGEKSPRGVANDGLRCI